MEISLRLFGGLRVFIRLHVLELGGVEEDVENTTQFSGSFGILESSLYSMVLVVKYMY